MYRFDILKIRELRAYKLGQDLGSFSFVTRVIQAVKGSFEYFDHTGWSNLVSGALRPAEHLIGFVDAELFLSSHTVSLTFAAVVITAECAVLFAAIWWRRRALDRLMAERTALAELNF